MNVRSILQIIGGTGEFTDAFGNGAVPPGITLGVVTNLVFDLRGNKTRDDLELPAYDLPEADSYYIAIDNDWSKATAPKLLRTTGISVDKSTGYTILTVPLPDTGSVPELASLLEAAKTLVLHCEIGGIKEGVGDVFAYSFDLVIRNRVWLPDSSPEDLPSDPDYLNTTEVQAYINAAVATALENIVGDTGPAPTITMGTVTTGATPGATLTPVTGEDGAYTLDLVMPVATGPTGPARQFGIGTITDGTEAAASLDLDGETYLLSLTLPRGQDGINPRGQWAIGTTYAINDVVRQAGAWWRSLQDDNTGNEPPATRIDNAYWEVIVKDGLDAEPLLRAYNDNDDPDDEDWHTTMLPGDTHFRESIDGGASWTIPKALTVSQGVIELYNIDATSDWAALAAGASYSTGFGKFMRARQDGGVWGEAYQIHDLAAQALRVQFSSGGAEPTWHATLQAGDTLAKFFNVESTINQTITISDGTFDVAEIQLCAVADPWHVTYDSTTDTYRKISIDGGETYTDPMPLQGKSAYQEWLDLGNEGTPQEFFDSLKATFPVGTPGQVLLLGPSGPYWGDLAAYTPVTPPPEPPEEVDLGLEDLPDGVEKRIWEYLPVRRPSDGRALHLFWQSSADGQTWGTAYSSATHPHCIKTKGTSGLVDFNTEYGPAMLPVEYIPVLEIHVRTCWGYLEEGIWHKGDWTYHNTLGVKLSLEGLPLEKPDYFNPEYFIIPIPESTDQCEFRLSTDDDFRHEQVLFSNTIYETDPKGFFFDGQNLLPAAITTTEALPVPFNAAAFEGQWFVFKRRGMAKYHIRAVWTGDNPVVYEWSPERAYMQED